MRIETIEAINYRQFRNVKIRFDKGASDLHIFIGRNGTGKTNILNAINWCLYNDEPHLSKASQQLPVVNLNALNDSKPGDVIPVEVAITAGIDKRQYIVFKRKAGFVVREDPETKQNVLDPQAQPEFTVYVSDASGNTTVVGAEEAKDYVERFIPKVICEYYLFDGERLDRYFEETVANVRHAVFVISQIAVLQRTKDHLAEVLKDARREAGRLSPEAERKEADLRAAQRARESVESKIEQCEQNIRDARAGVKECDDALRGVPDLEQLEKRRAELLSRQDQKGVSLDDKIKTRRTKLIEYGRLLPFIPIIKRTLDVTRVKKEQGVIPPPADPALLQSSLEIGTCQACGRSLDSESREEVQALLESILLSSGIGKTLWEMAPDLRNLLKSAKDFKQVMDSIAAGIDDLTMDLANIQKELNDIDRKVTGFPIETIKARYRQRSDWERIRDEELTRRGSLKTEREGCLEAEARAKKAWEHELKKLTKATELRGQIDVASEALRVISETTEEIMEGTRERVQAETNKLFLGLVWKKKTFESVLIGADYSISLMHQTGYDCLGSISAAERELLALSFVLALHRVSGFDSPILIDTPVARISDVQRENFAKVLSEVGLQKQVILLFTPSEYTDDLSPILEASKESKLVLQISADEHETTPEVL